MAPRTILRRLAPLLLAGLAAVAIAEPAQATVFGPRAGHSPNADDIRTAYWVAIATAALLVIAVHAFLIAAVVRFRARRGRAPRPVAAGPGAFARPAAPLALIAVGMFVFAIVMAGKARTVEPTGSNGFGASSSLVAQVGGLSVPPDAKPLTINAIGQQFLWRFEYPGGRPGDRVFSYGELVVPVDTVPGETADTWFRADREGVYEGQSTFFSGTSYAAMRAWVRVVSPDAYRQFVRQKRSDLKAAQSYVQQKVTKNAIPGLGP
ncbi:MAG: hypothetical protein AUG48_02150 [Actinobacteria bacterium 13_1_20CM_3_68_9]|nr:MAG: hypothetical protein AUG48_02150 [Actinobacteria bacterium 13_1_20CM_3_68_9]